MRKTLAIVMLAALVSMFVGSDMANAASVPVNVTADYIKTFTLLDNNNKQIVNGGEIEVSQGTTIILDVIVNNTTDLGRTDFTVDAENNPGGSYNWIVGISNEGIEPVSMHFNPDNVAGSRNGTLVVNIGYTAGGQGGPVLFPFQITNTYVYGAAAVATQPSDLFTIKFLVKDYHGKDEGGGGGCSAAGLGALALTPLMAFIFIYRKK